MGSSEEVVRVNDTEIRGTGGVPCASMEKGQLLCCSCKIIGIGCSCRQYNVRVAWPALHCAVQWDHVEVTGGVFCSRQNNLSIFGDVHCHWTKVDRTAMGTELGDRYEGQVDLFKLVTSTCLVWQVTKVEAISCLGLYGTAISISHSDTIGGILVFCAMVGCWNKMVGGVTI